jgi:predicted PurR-regulated permease PerM
VTEGQLGWRLSAQAWWALLALGLTFWLIYSQSALLAEIAGVLFGGLLVGLAIRPVAGALAARKVPRGLTVIVVYFLVLGLWVLMGNLLVPTIQADVAYFRGHGLGLLQSAFNHITTLPVVDQLFPSPGALSQTLAQRVDAFTRVLIDAVTSIGGFALDLLLALVMGYFVASDMTLGRGVFEVWVPADRKAALQVLLGRLERRLTRWIWAQLAVGLYFAIVFTLGLSLLRVPFGVTIGIVGGVVEIIPYVGGVIAFTLAVLSALTINPWLALWVVVFYVLVVELESHVVAPALYGRVLNLHPAVVLLALVVGGKLGGVIGLLFAVPIVVVLAVLLEEAGAVVDLEAEPEQSSEGKLAATNRKGGKGPA